MTSSAADVRSRYVLADQLRAGVWAEEPIDDDNVGNYAWACQSKHRCPRVNEAWVHVITLTPVAQPQLMIELERYVVHIALMRLLNVVGVPRAAEGHEHAYWRAIGRRMFDESARSLTWPEARWRVEGQSVAARVGRVAGCEVGFAQLPDRTIVAVIGRHLQLHDARLVMSDDFGRRPRWRFAPKPARLKEPLPEPMDEIVRAL